MLYLCLSQTFLLDGAEAAAGWAAEEVQRRLERRTGNLTADVVAAIVFLNQATIFTES